MNSVVDIHNAYRPLRLIAWGAAIVILDFSFSSTTTTNGEVTSGFRFDVINDVVGMVLIFLGVNELARFRVDVRYGSILTFLKVVALAGCAYAAMNHFVFAYPPVLTLLVTILGIANLVAAYLFCVAMMQLSRHHQLAASHASWQTSWLLMAIFWIFPVGLLHLATLYSLVTGEIVRLNPGPFILVVLVLMLLPVIHAFVSIKTMMNESANLPHGKQL